MLPTLKHGKLVRLALTAAGTGVAGDTLTYFKAPVRYRDLALSPDGRRIYQVTVSATVSSGPSKADPKGTSCQGCILEFTYQHGGQPAPSTSGAPAPAKARKLGAVDPASRRAKP